MSELRIERARSAAHIFLPVLVGGLIYVGFRSEDLLLWRWAEALGVRPALHALRTGLVALVGTLPDVVRFSLPDALWTYGLAYLVTHLSRTRLMALVPIALGPGAELAQALGWIPGVFDAADLVSCGLAVALGVTTATLRKKQGHERRLDSPSLALGSDVPVRAARGGDLGASGG